MPGMINPGTLWKVVRAGHPAARLRATRDGLTAIRVHLCAAAVETGVLDALADGDATTADLAGRLGVVDAELLAAFLRMTTAAGLVSGGDGRPWQLTGRGRAIVDDDLVRAGYEGFSGLHTAIYRDMASMLTGGPRRRDMAEHGALIARLSQGFEPLVMEVLTRAVAGRRPHRVLDIGCGAGLELAAMLEAAPAAHGVGVDVDAAAAGLAERTLRERGLSGRASVLQCDVRDPTARTAGRCRSRSTSPCWRTSSTTCRWPSGFRCSATSPGCWPRAGCCSSSRPWRRGSTSAGTSTCCSGRRRGRWRSRTRPRSWTSSPRPVSGWIRRMRSRPGPRW